MIHMGIHTCIALHKCTSPDIYFYLYRIEEVSDHGLNSDALERGRAVDR